MKQRTQADRAHLDPDEVSPSLRDVAAYLRGVADATNALSQPPPVQAQGLEIERVVSASARNETLVDECPTPSRATIPYDGHEGRADTIPVGPAVGSFSPEAAAGEGSFFHDVPEEPFVDERASEVRLRIGQLSPEWYALLNVRAG
jgi:hypothetical protein